MYVFITFMYIYNIRLVRGIDYEGNLCGIDKPTKGLDNIWYPTINGANFNSQNVLVPIGFGVCTKICPKQDGLVIDPYG